MIPSWLSSMACVPSAGGDKWTITDSLQEKLYTFRRRPSAAPCFRDGLKGGE